MKSWAARKSVRPSPSASATRSAPGPHSSPSSTGTTSTSALAASTNGAGLTLKLILSISPTRLPVRLDLARRHPQVVGEPVEVGHDLGPFDPVHPGVGHPRRSAPGRWSWPGRARPPASSARGPRTLSHAPLDFDAVDRLLQGSHHLGGDQRGARLELVSVLGGGGELGADHEHLSLQIEEHPGQLGLGVGGHGSGDPQRRHRFVGGAVGLRPGVVLGHPATVEEPGAAVVTLPGVHLHGGEVRFLRTTQSRQPKAMVRPRNSTPREVSTAR